ncbi:hypothetical protein BC567DRAFT_229705 [Phyllosticta citribraziliensis]
MNAGWFGQRLDAGRRRESAMTARSSRAEKRSDGGVGAGAAVEVVAEVEVEIGMCTTGPHPHGIARRLHRRGTPAGTTTTMALERFTPSTMAMIGGTTRRCHRRRSMAVRCCGHSRSCGLSGTTLLTVGGRRRRCWRCRFQHRCRLMAIRVLVFRLSLHPARNGCGKYRRPVEPVSEVVGRGVMRE